MAPFGEATSGAEIVGAFPKQIEGKTCRLTPLIKDFKII
jgi:hypothetical protein